MTILTLTPLNDFTLSVELRKVNALGKSEPLITGTVTAFLSASNLQTATAADATLSVTCTHVGRGVWIAHFDASVLTVSLLNSLFAVTPPYCHFVAPNDIRKHVPVTYSPTAPAEVP